MAKSDPPMPTADGLVRTMYAMLQTDLQFGVILKPSDLGWMANAREWMKSLNEKDRPTLPSLSDLPKGLSKKPKAY